VKAGFSESLLRSQTLIEEQLAEHLAMVDGTTGDLVTLAQRIEGRRPARDAAAAAAVAGGRTVLTPVPVTRGSGTPGRATKAKGREGVQPPEAAGKGVISGALDALQESGRLSRKDRETLRKGASRGRL
jgi:hypothetical protein